MSLVDWLFDMGPSVNHVVNYLHTGVEFGLRVKFQRTLDLRSAIFIYFEEILRDFAPFFKVEARLKDVDRCECF